MDRERFCRLAWMLEIALRAELKTFRHLQPVGVAYQDKRAVRPIATVGMNDVHLSGFGSGRRGSVRSVLINGLGALSDGRISAWPVAAKTLC